MTNEFEESAIANLQQLVKEQGTLLKEQKDRVEDLTARNVLLVQENEILKGYKREIDRVMGLLW